MGSESEDGTDFLDLVKFPVSAELSEEEGVGEQGGEGESEEGSKEGSEESEEDVSLAQGLHGSNKEQPG